MVTRGREIIMVRSVFKYAKQNGLIEREINYGSEFAPPSNAEKRKARAKRKLDSGKRMFEAAEIKAMLAKALPQLKAMILLAINGGLGNTDCATLPKTAIDLKAGWIDFPRPKTGVDRRFPLWPETVKALREAMDSRPDAKDAAHDGLVFLTRLGQPWVRYDLETSTDDKGRLQMNGKAADAVATATAKLLNELGIKRPGLSFYALRHTFETIAGGCKDQVAVDYVMGHVDPSMAAVYREQIDDARLQSVVDHVHAWLYPPEEGEQDGRGDAEQPAAVPMKTRPRKAKAARIDAAERAGQPFQFRIVG
jgi:integrase